jgi:mono/diheme cytochrome c family protein
VTLSLIRAVVASVFAFVAVALAGCTSLPGKPAPSSIPIQPNDVTNFAQLYAQNCQGCHGINGAGGIAVGLAAPGYLAFADAAQIKQVTSAGVPGTAMPAFAQADGGLLTPAQIDALVQGIETNFAAQSQSFEAEAAHRSQLPPYAPTAATAGNAAHGAATFQKFCASCHGPEGKGSSSHTQHSIVHPAYLALVSDQNLRTTVVVGRPDLGSPNYCGDLRGECLTPQEVSDVVAWLAARRTPYAGQPYPNNAAPDTNATAPGAARP